MKKILAALVFFLLLGVHPAFANTCAWVSGSTKNWSDTTAWTSCGGVAPTAADDVTVSGTGTLTIDGTSGSPSLARSVDFTGFTGTLTHASAKQLNVGDASGGSFKLVSGMTYSPGGTAVLKFVSTTTGNNITFGTKSPPLMTFDGVGGGWQLQDVPGTALGATWTLTNGSLDVNGKAITGSFSSNNSNTRSLTLGAMTWTITQAASQSWDISTSTGMTLSAASSIIQFNTDATTSAFKGGSLVYGSLTSTAITTGTVTITGSNNFTSLTLSTVGTTKATTSGYALTAGTTQTSTNCTFNGNTTLLRNFIYSTTTGTPATISCANAPTATHTDFRDITGAGAGSWNFSGLTSTANGNGGNNSGITFTSPKTCYLKTAVSANWSAGPWETASGGSTACVPAMPLLQDHAVIDVNGVTAVSKIITLDEPRIPDTDWSGVANTPAFATGTDYEVYGGLHFVSGMTHTGTGDAFFSGYGTFNFYSGGLTYAVGQGIGIANPNTTINQQDNITTGNVFGVFTGGTWNGNGFTLTSAVNQAFSGANVNLGGASTLGSFSISSGALKLGGLLTLSSAGVSVSGGTFDMNGYGVTGGTTTAVSGAGVLNLSGQINGSGAITVSGGTINDSGAAGELKGTTASFTGGTSVVRKLTLSSTFAMSSTASLTFPVGGSATWATSWTDTGTTHSLKFGGVPNFVNGSLTVGGGNRPSMGAP